MPTTNEVFSLRKAGSIDEAYALALEIYEEAPNDEWCIKAIAWCLYDLIKRCVAQNDYANAKPYLTKLDKLNLSELDEILLKSIEHIKRLASPEKKIIFQAKEESKQGNHQEALNLFRQAIIQFPDDLDLNIQFGWELQKEAKLIFESEKVDIHNARKLLAEYIKLKNERPSQLHSLFLNYAHKISEKEEFNYIAFLKLWDLNNLRPDDFKPFTKDDKTFPSIAEKTIQHAAKIILDKKLANVVDYFLPFIDIGIQKFKDNIWLNYYKAKLLHLINRNDEAINFLIPVVKEKISEFWTWSLLGELVLINNFDLKISCYCKSLLCSGEDKFLANVRIKLAELLIQKELWNEAKYEIEQAITAKEKVSDKLTDYQKKEWFLSAQSKKNNTDFYNLHKQLAEEFIFQSLPWFDGCLGETFIIPEKPDKPRRKIFIKTASSIIEVVISDRKFHTAKNYKIGDSIKIKGEYDKEKIFQIYLLEKRNSNENWSIFESSNGNAIHAIQDDKNNITAWRISVLCDGKIKEGIIDKRSINSQQIIKSGMPLYVKYFQKEQPKNFSFFTEEHDTKIQILSISERKDGIYWDIFPENIGIVDHINVEKGIAHFIVNKKVDGIIKLNQLNNKIEVGTKLMLKIKKVTKEKSTYYTALTYEITQQEPTEILIKSFMGIVNISGSVGFADDVFIENSLISENSIEDGSIVKGIAIINYNKKKGKWGWKAINIENM